MFGRASPAATAVIDDCVPYEPEPARKYNWGKMKIGDSFLVTNAVSRQSLTSSARQWRIRTGNTKTQFRTRATKDGIRVWRVADSAA